jgi:hypothetical protein
VKARHVTRKQTKSKLPLRRQRIDHLSPTELSQAAGGASDSDFCDPNCAEWPTGVGVIAGPIPATRRP